MNNLLVTQFVNTKDAMFAKSAASGAVLCALCCLGVQSYARLGALSA